ncbi:MAG: ABC transporter ATP-binding protein [SAR202 cluster bacterium]|nr:ABC transporter [Chloroflexota bacterium]MQG22619.1 ABC transporter ATP-binding protein [SAR202 cluster bacterium]
MIYIFRIIKIALVHKERLILAYLCTAGAVASYVVLPMIFGNVIDKVVDNLVSDSSDYGYIYISAGIILGLSIIRGISSFFQTYMAEALSQDVSYDLRNQFYDHIQYQGFDFHDRYHTGNLMSRAITDIENIRMFINMGLVRSAYFVSLFIIVAIILVNLNWQLGLIGATFMPVVAIYTAKIRLKMRSLYLIVQEKMADLSIVMNENFSGIRVVKAFGAQNYEENKFDSKSLDVAKVFVRAEQLRSSSLSFMLFTFLIAISLVLFFGGRLAIQGELTPGELAQFVFYLQILAMPVRMAGWVVNSYARAASAGERLFEILDSKSNVQDTLSPVIMSKVKGDVYFENISFAYQKGNNVLENFTLNVNHGETIALLGSPGSGKSTLMNLLPRFYDVNSGRILIDNTDIKDFSLESLRNNIGIIHQDVFLFTDTLKENISYGLTNTNLEDIKNAASIAMLDEFIDSLENGYDTYIGERGSTLSGGQRQRMAIARVVLMNPPILILDDSTSNVDSDTEDKIKNALNSIMEDRTTFVIANRLSTVHQADRILVMDKGNIVDEGTHKELISKSGIYKNIYNLQLKPQEDFFKEIDISKDGLV